MPATWSRALALAATLLAGSGALGTAPAFGRGLVRDVVYASPVETVYVPSSYVVPTSYSYVTTSAVVPTVYATSYATPTYSLSPTAYLLPTYYRTTGLFGRRRVVEQPVYATSYTLPLSTYYPTAYYYPTTYYASSAYYTTAYYTPTTYYAPTTYYTPTAVEYPVTITSGSGCVSAPSPAYQPYTPNNSSGSQPSRTSPVPPSERVPSEVRSAPAESAPATRSTESAPYVESPTGTPPAPTEPAPEKDFPLAPTRRDAAPKKAPVVPSPPVAPSSNESAPGTPLQDQDQESLRQEVRKPVLNTPAPLVQPSLVNVLVGKVYSRDTGDVVEGVPVTLSNRGGAFADRVVRTDALGRFAVRLPDGDWEVRITMPSGSVRQVTGARGLTVSNGRITNELGEDIPSLIIRR